MLDRLQTGSPKDDMGWKLNKLNIQGIVSKDPAKDVNGSTYEQKIFFAYR